MSAPDTRPLAAATCVISAMALIGLVDNFVVQIAAEGGLFQFHFLRALMALPLIVVVAVMANRRWRAEQVWAVAVRSALIAASMFCYFGALAFLTVAETSAGLFTAPIWVLLVSVLFLGQRVRLPNALAAAAGFTGVLLVLQPDPTNLSPALVLPLAAGVLYALGSLATRGLCAGEGTFALLVGFFVAMVIAGGIGTAVLHWAQLPAPEGPEGFITRGWVVPSGTFMALTAMQAVASVIGVGLIFRGYLLAEAAYVAVFEYVLLIFAAFWGWILWGQTLNIFAWAGLALIIVSGAYLARLGDNRDEPVAR